MTTSTKTTSRTIRVTIPFEPCIGGRIGAVMIRTASPYSHEDHYLVKIDDNGLEATWMKENGDKTNHVVDMDMNCCDCAGWNHRRVCRHISAMQALKAAGKV